MATHKDENLNVLPKDIRILTGMNNLAWEEELKNKVPACLENQIFHHGKLNHSKMKNLRNALIIIDEIDTGDKQFQNLHMILRDSGIMDITTMVERNIRFVFTSATILRELYDLDNWGHIHCHYRMTIPPNYIGHKEFLEKGLIQEFFPIETIDDAIRWIKEDILDRYGKDSRVHMIRLKNYQQKDKRLSNAYFIRRACIQNGIIFKEHNSSNRISDSEMLQLFEKPLQRHVVIGIKGFFRRSNLIPNAWKRKIGAMHETWTRQVDNNVQVQGLCGRMSGYWKETLDEGHLTGPYRTSIKAIKQYEETYEDPFGENSYNATGFIKKNGKVNSSIPTFVSPKWIGGLDKESVDKE
jgi:hypothetical protein